MPGDPSRRPRTGSCSRSATRAPASTHPTCPTTQGLGLAGIREQAELLGGGFGLVSRRGAGTRLSVWWPVQAVAEPA